MIPNHRRETDPNRIVAIRRDEVGMTQGELARALGYKNTNFISMIENGQSEVPVDRAVDIANALGIDARFFTERVLRKRHPSIANVLLGSEVRIAPSIGRFAAAGAAA